MPRSPTDVGRRGFLMRAAGLAAVPARGLPGDVAPEHTEVQELNPALAGIRIYGDRLPAPVLALSGVEAPAQQ